MRPTSVSSQHNHPSQVLLHIGPAEYGKIDQNISFYGDWETVTSCYFPVITILSSIRLFQNQVPLALFVSCSLWRVFQIHHCCVLFRMQSMQPTRFWNRANISQLSCHPMGPKALCLTMNMSHLRLCVFLLY